MRFQAMKTLLLAALAAGFSLSIVVPAEAISGAQRASTRYTNLTCHQKIDPKKLKGQALKDAWKACLESPDMYN
jgi:hypothetical protein